MIEKLLAGLVSVTIGLIVLVWRINNARINDLEQWRHLEDAQAPLLRHRVETLEQEVKKLKEKP